MYNQTNTAYLKHLTSTRRNAPFIPIHEVHGSTGPMSVGLASAIALSGLLMAIHHMTFHGGTIALSGLLMAIHHMTFHGGTMCTGGIEKGVVLVLYISVSKV
jgi:hypothetical protein